jgi:hypothetical protein
LSASASSALAAPEDGYERWLPEFPYGIRIFWPRVPDALPLAPLAGKLDAMRAALAQAGPPPYLGVTWRAGTPPEAQGGVSWVLYKQVAIDALARAVRDFPGTLLALQRLPAPGEIDSLHAALGRPIADFTALNEELETMLALLALIDEYVGVSNTNMHLRAGAGKSARVLVPAPAEWRWMYGGRESPWFPGFSVYRQSLQGDWSPALAALNQDLARACAPRPASA